MIFTIYSIFSLLLVCSGEDDIKKKLLIIVNYTLRKTGKWKCLIKNLIEFFSVVAE